MSPQKQIIVKALAEKLEKLTGKKVVFESKSTISAEKIQEIKSLVEMIEKLSNKKVVIEGMDKELEEGLFGPSEDQVKADFLKTINAWAAKGYQKPTDQEFAQIMAQAKADKFQGKLGVTKDKKIGYRSAKDIKWGSQFAGGGTGGSPTGGTAGA